MAFSVGLLSAGCSAASISENAPPRSQSAAPRTESASPSSDGDAPSSVVPTDVAATAREFTRAYAGHDARVGGDVSYADAGERAAKFAAGDLAEALVQKRPGQDAPWAALRAGQARQSVTVTSVEVPDGAPAVTSSSALVRVSYVLTTTPRPGAPLLSREQLALRLERTSAGWRVVALPWA
ncbi:hypothetical protein IAG44_20330 [Streptomyces roseirectus]|uniref:Mce-associated membrane protein n=1 Tax=Streptomyces roseirectus TaxID=2768066 RepID=A0A7H0ISV4_9ACTN|nr:hypothetical protein IAG44_20330 [Streptomyces roseirectus]